MHWRGSLKKRKKGAGLVTAAEGELESTETGQKASEDKESRFIPGELHVDMSALQSRDMELRKEIQRIA